MAGFTSNADIVAAYNAGQVGYIPFRKVNALTSPVTAALWLELISTSQTIPFTGTAGVAVAMNSSTSNALPLNGDVDPKKRYLSKITVQTPSATMVPGYLLLCDFLLFYPTCAPTPGAETVLDNTVTLPRYTDGKDVKLVGVAQSFDATGIITPTYYNNDDVLTTPALGAVTTLSDTVTAGILLSIYDPVISGTALNNSFFQGSSGVKSVNSYAVTNAGIPGGTFTFLLVKILASVPIITTTSPSEKDFIHQSPEFIEIKDGACLGFLYNSGGAVAAGTILTGSIEYIWS